MNWKFGVVGGLVAAFVVDVSAVPPADACGVKLAVKYAHPRKVASRSNTPSKVLLVGAPPKRLEHDLSTAGHDVEVEPTTGNAKRPTYDVVLVASNDQATEAHSKFPDATVMVRSGDVTADVRSVESQVGRRPVRAEQAREVIAAGPSREPIGAKPADPRPVNEAKPVEPRTVVAAKDPTPEPPAPRLPIPEKVATTTVTAKPEISSEPTPPPKTVKTAAALSEEIYFTLGSASLGNRASLDRAVRWLKANAGSDANLGGHADPTGTPDGNMTLSQLRAESVRDYLVKAGIDASRLHVNAFGDTQLKYGRTDQRNRRVIIEATK